MENKRLTKKIIEKNVDGYVLNHREDFTENTYEVIQKLGRLEDLEEEIGCPLEVLESALMNGIYTNVYSGLCVVSRFQDVLSVSDDYGVYIKDYKKTWWLREDKSE